MNKTLSDLHMSTKPFLSDSVFTNSKTAIRSLAEALGHQSPDDIFVSDLPGSIEAIYDAINEWAVLRDKGAHTLRNTKNLLSRQFRILEENNIFSLIRLIPVADLELDRIKPSIARSIARSDVHARKQKGLPIEEWGADNQKEWEKIHHWATAPLIEGRDSKHRKRETTILNYKYYIGRFFGYLVYVKNEEPNFHKLFNYNELTGYYQWCINELYGENTLSLVRHLSAIKHLASKYIKDEELTQKLREFSKTLPKTRRQYDKNDIWVPLKTIHKVGYSLYPSMNPHQVDRNSKSNPNRVGTKMARRASLGVIIQLWTFVPLRQRNIREMKLGKNLFKSPDGEWTILFKGDELKIGEKNGKENVFTCPFPPLVIHYLEDYLTNWRPILEKLNGDTEHVFLSMKGEPWDVHTFYNSIRYVFEMYVQKPFHPHMIRTIWATEWIKGGGDFHTAAIMLNDNLKTVIENYSHLLETDVANNAFSSIESKLQS